MLSEKSRQITQQSTMIPPYKPRGGCRRLLSQIVAAVEPQIVHVLVGFTLAKLPDLAKPRHEYVYLLVT